MRATSQSKNQLSWPNRRNQSLPRQNLSPPRPDQARKLYDQYHAGMVNAHKNAFIPGIQQEGIKGEINSKASVEMVQLLIWFLTKGK
ncbi:hypothetical protein ACOSQ2_004058 [Xanthoceras sorbifolium]